MIEAAFDAVSEFVQVGIVSSLLAAVDLRWDDDRCAHGLGVLDDGPAVIASIRDHSLSLAIAQQGEGFGVVAALPGREAELERLSVAVDQQMDLGRQTSSASPQSLVAPFLRPVAACWCALTMVESNIR